MWLRVRCGSKPAASIWILSTTVWQRTISRAWLWSSVWAGHELDLTSQRAMRWGWADSGPAAQSTLHPPEAAHPGPECISQSTDRRHSPERAVLKMSEDKTLSFLASLPEFRDNFNFTYQPLAQLTRCSRLVNRTPSPQSFHQLPYATSLQVTHNKAVYITTQCKSYAVFFLFPGIIHSKSYGWKEYPRRKAHSGYNSQGKQ